MPTIVNLRQDPFERTPIIRGESMNDMGGGYMNDFYAREFWRFVLVQKEVGRLAMTAIEYPPMQDPPPSTWKRSRRRSRRRSSNTRANNQPTLYDLGLENARAASGKDAARGVSCAAVFRAEGPAIRPAKGEALVPIRPHAYFPFAPGGPGRRRRPARQRRKGCSPRDRGIPGRCPSLGEGLGLRPEYVDLVARRSFRYIRSELRPAALAAGGGDENRANENDRRACGHHVGIGESIGQRRLHQRNRGRDQVAALVSEAGKNPRTRSGDSSLRCAGMTPHVP